MHTLNGGESNYGLIRPDPIVLTRKKGWTAVLYDNTGLPGIVGGNYIVVVFPNTLDHHVSVQHTKRNCVYLKQGLPLMNFQWISRTEGRCRYCDPIPRD